MFQRERNTLLSNIFKPSLASWSNKKKKRDQKREFKKKKRERCRKEVKKVLTICSTTASHIQNSEVLYQT